MLKSPDEPNDDLSIHCNKPYPCAFWKYCSRHVPSPSVFDLYRLPFKKKIAYYQQGMAGFDKLLHCPDITGDKQLRQIEYALEDKGTYLDKPAIRDFLRLLRYYDLHYPDYHAAYEGLDARTFRRDRQLARDVLLIWKEYDMNRMQRDEDVEEELTAEFMARLKNL